MRCLMPGMPGPIGAAAASPGANHSREDTACSFPDGSGLSVTW